MKERVSFGLQLRRDKSPSRLGGIAAKSRHDHKQQTWQQMQEVEKAQLQLQTQSRESHLEKE